MITQGAIRIERMSQGGKRLLLAILGPGEVVGEMSLISGQPRMADAIAHENSELYQIEKATFDKIISEHPSVSGHLMAILSGRLLNTGVNLQRVGLSSLQSRLAYVLVDLAARFANEKNPSLINLKLTQTDLADLAVSSREHVNKILQVWKAENVITIEQG